MNTLTKIKKITSGSTPEVADIVDALYNSILLNGTHRAPNMKVAEAAKAVENSQRDVNISFMNELALICDRVGIDTNDVIEAAVLADEKTKKYTDGKQVMKVIIVPKKIVNVVCK